ncbi:MAG: hypothetical protein KGJ59_07525 [Bacteroidota bacterium]|nr:hypothetical protein [Bacteroidota bacterium]
MMRAFKNSIAVLLLFSYGFVGGAGIVAAWTKLLNSGGEPHAVSAAKASRPLTSLPVYVQASQSPTSPKYDSVHHAVLTERTPLCLTKKTSHHVLVRAPNIVTPSFHYFSPRSPPRS